MALNRQITIIAIVLAACLTCGGQNETKPDAGEMRGRVTEVDRANVSQNPKLLGSILIEGDRPSPNDKVVANITTDTRIFEQQGNARVSVAFEALKVGQMVSAKFTGPGIDVLSGTRRSIRSRNPCCAGPGIKPVGQSA